MPTISNLCTTNGEGNGEIWRKKGTITFSGTCSGTSSDNTVSVPTSSSPLEVPFSRELWVNGLLVKFSNLAATVRSTSPTAEGRLRIQIVITLYAGTGSTEIANINLLSDDGALLTAPTGGLQDYTFNNTYRFADVNYAPNTYGDMSFVDSVRVGMTCRCYPGGSLHLLSFDIDVSGAVEVWNKVVQF
jgi:hypothetical protein